MKFSINKRSEISAHEQLREQIIFLISTGELAIGEEMPSVRALSRQLGISLNTVSKVYSELARANWLVERVGARHKVVERKSDDGPRATVTDLDDLIDRTIGLAQAHGYSLQQLVKRLRLRLLEQPPDHFLIVEPDPGLGEMMREEIRERIGYSLPVCSLFALQENPALRIGAILITPSYLVDRLTQFAAERRRILPVTYSPFNSLIDAISKLPQPSMLGWISISEAGLKTISGTTAPAIGNLHSSHYFLLELGNTKHRYEIRRYDPEEYHPSDILKPVAAARASVVPGTGQKARPAFEVVSNADLRCMDLLFCDSVAASILSHPRLIRYQLLSDASLKRIEAEAAALPLHEA